MISVILCTHNPKPDYLRRVIDGLRLQTFPLSNWELIFIDNASHSLLSDTTDLSWHPSGYNLRVDELGLTVSRLQGIKRAKGDVLVFVDDDLVLAPDYLENAHSVLDKRDYLGAIGGEILGEFESRVPLWLKPYFSFIAIHNWGNTSKITNDKFANNTLPCGAGMVLRTTLARSYASKCKDLQQTMFGRKGKSLAGSEDTDIIFHVIDQDYCVGYFPDLKCKHLIPQNRLKLSYIARLRREGAKSRLILDHANGRISKISPKHMWLKLICYALLSFPFKMPWHWWIGVNSYLGQMEGKKFILDNLS